MAWMDTLTNLISAVAGLLAVIWLHRMVKPISAALTGVAAHMTTRKVADVGKLVDETRKLIRSDNQESG